MARRATSRRPLKQPAVGDMRELIDLVESRSLNSLNINDPHDTGHSEKGRYIFGKVEDISPRAVFDGVSLEDRPTHKFTIRYNPNVNAESTLKHRDDYYRVIDVSNLDERREFMICNCKLKGKTNRAAAR